MKSLVNEKSFWLLLGFVLAGLSSFLLFNAAGTERVVEVTSIVPVTRVVQVTRLIPVVVKAPSTQLPPAQGIQLVPVTRIVEIPEYIPATAAVAPPAVPEPTEMPPQAPTAIFLTPYPSPIPAPGSLLFSAGDYLYQMNLDGSGVRIVASGLQDSEHLTADPPYGKLYLTFWEQPAQIRTFSLYNPGIVNPLHDGPTSGGQGLAIDSANRKLYVGLYYDGVYVMDLNQPGSWNQVVDPGALSPMIGQRGQLQIDPANRQIYFRTAFNGDCDECRYIWRVDFDGGNLIKIIRANGGDALALDLLVGKMYFSDVPDNRAIKRANLDGSSVETILTLAAPYDFCKALALDLSSQKIYLKLYNSDGNFWMAIARANLDGSNFEILYQVLGNSASEVAGGMTIVTP